MNKQKLKTEELDKIGRSLLEATIIDEAEIEKIIAAPQLFNLVRARIEEQKSVQTKSSSFLLLLNWQRAGLSIGALVILLTAIIGVSVFGDWHSSLKFETTEKIVPEIQVSDSLVEDLAASIGDAGPAGRKLTTRTVFSKTSTRLTKQPVKAISRPPIEEIEEEREFYPLTFVGDLEEMQADAQIVRVELTRSSLTALGISPPVENMAEKIKTELLIGSDGVTRGIRFLK